MAFSYHAPTRTKCDVCEELHRDINDKPIIDTVDGRASASNGFPFHDWYNFVLGYTPTFPEYMLSRENITKDNLVVDPFGGSGTTQLVCKYNQIPSIGIDANDFMVYAAKQKLNWKIDLDDFSIQKKSLMRNIDNAFGNFDFESSDKVEAYANKYRPENMDKRYISDLPLLKVYLIKNEIDKMDVNREIKELFKFALSAILVPVSNVRYGPGFGVRKPREDFDVKTTYYEKLKLIENDLCSVTKEQKDTLSQTILGDSRHLSDYIEKNSVSLMITSPPYPGDHEYTKHSKVELIYNGMASDIASFRVIKKRMIVSSTTNIYKENHARELVSEFDSIKEVTEEIRIRLEHDNATSGYEKLYTKLVWEYFGCMKQVLEECYKVLKKGGKIALLVSDSHAFKMVHIQTAKILKEIGLSIGYVNPEIELWQLKNSTSHKYQLRENILILEK